MKSVSKAAGSSAIVGEWMITSLPNASVMECTIPDAWLKSVTVNAVKRKSDLMFRNNHRGLKLLDQVMKLGRVHVIN